MAISAVEYFLMRMLREQNLLPLGGDLLQLGESNWYGDLHIGTFRADIEKFAAAPERDALLARFDAACTLPWDQQTWELAEIYWRTFLQPASMTAIDFHGTESALKLDLNTPIELDRKFNFIMNGGTLEHVFNIAQGFKTIHDHLAPGGFVYHAVPFTGWIDHGFFNINPTLVWDLAAANGYHVCLLAYCELNPPKVVQLANREQILKMAAGGAIRPNANLYAVLRSPDQAAPFRVPIQGYYTGQLSGEAEEAWRKLR